MATVDAEKKLQKRVLHWLVDDLGYTYLGNLEDIDNTPVKENLLKANLKKRGYSDDQIKTAISELLGKVNNQVDTLYQINRSVYSLLRYGRQVQKMQMGVVRRYIISIGMISAAMIFMLQRKYLSCVSIR